MDWLYRVFYTVISLGILMALFLPVVAAVRFLLHNDKKKYTIWAWRIFYLRSICPAALSSAFCMIPSWNRKYHLFLTKLGLQIEGSDGIMQSWRAVFQKEVTASRTFGICSVIWLAGVLGTLFLASGQQRKLKRELKSAKQLGENIYESPQIQEPVWFGGFHKRIYLPQGFQTKETAWLLRHVEAHSFAPEKRVIINLITAVHWFNPMMWLYRYWWQLDEEMAADEKTVRGRNAKESREYAQSILNFSKTLRGDNGSRTGGYTLLFSGVTEGGTEKRAHQMLYPKRAGKREGLTAVMLLSVLIIFSFLLTPLRMAWSGGTWGKDSGSAQTEELFTAKDATVIAKMGTTSPEGLERVIQLEMLSGEESKNYYEGNFVLKMYDSVENEIASCKVESIFPEIEKGKQRFVKNVTLCMDDYNGDSTQELVIGQELEGAEDAIGEAVDSEEAASYGAYSYAIVNIEDTALSVLCDDITVIAPKTELSESVLLEQPEGISDIFMVQQGDKTVYYAWNETKKTYQKRNMTQEQLEEHKKGTEQAAAGKTVEHTLENADSETIVLLTAKEDSTGSEEIQSVALYPRGASKRFDDIKGYYCDLLWVTDTESKEEERYAQLIYNGTKSQTFALYDTKRKKVYYQHEDGTSQLAAVFAQYQEGEITFEENGAVVYSLAEKAGDVLTINFAAEADGGVAIKGSYDYDVVKRTASNLSFNRTVDESASAAP